MILISCADNSLGLRFNGRRQSRDRAVSARIQEKTGGEIWLAQESEALFPGANIHIVSQPEGDWCFWERPAEAMPEKIILYRWNRDYPGDVFFAFPGGAEHWILESQEDFKGFSHETLTEEIYLPQE